MRGYNVTPRVAPVCGGIDIIIEGIDHLSLKRQEKSTLVAIEGSRQRHLCSTVSHPSIPNTVVCAIPEHEPAEECSLSLIFFGTVNDCIEIIPIGRLQYQTDQTQLLAVYLAKSVHDVESLEDWDEIRGTGFSLCNEDFATLDERLCAAFHHLLLPDGWSLLGDNKVQMARETLFHFCARLGLVKFIRLLFSKPGAELCLSISNRHDQYPKDLADSRQYDDLYRILSDEDAIEHFKTEPVVTHELHEGACLRYTEHGTVNIDIDVSDPATKKTIGYNVKSLKNALLSTEDKFSCEGSFAGHNERIIDDIDGFAAQQNGENMRFLNVDRESQERRTSQITLHLSDSRPNSADDLISATGAATEGSLVKMRTRHSSDDFDVMPDVKRRSMIAQHLSDTLNSGERRHSWHESEQNLLELIESKSSEKLQRSRSYEHIDEPELSGDELNDSAHRPIEATQEEIIQIEHVLAENRRKLSSQDDRRRAIVIKDVNQKGKPTLHHHNSQNHEQEFVKEKRLMDERKHELPQKLASKSGTKKSFSKESFLSFFPGRTEKRGRKGSSPRKMPSIQSDTDTDSENKKYSSLERHESNSSTDDRALVRGDSLKDARNIESDEESLGNSDFEEDVELNTREEPDNWGKFVAEQGLPVELGDAPNPEKERKRQENIYEFIKTEKKYSQSLRVMQKIFIGRMRKELGYSSAKCSQFFPQLRELSSISHEFIRIMSQRQAESPNVVSIGDILYDFWNSDWGERKANAYSELCKRQKESLKFYHTELKNNKKFAALIQKYKNHPLAKRYEVPDITQLATQRVTKYPIMIKEMLKNTYDKKEKKNLTKALELIQQIIFSVDGEVQKYAGKMELTEIVANIDPSSFTYYGEKKFKRKNLTQYDRALVEAFNVQIKTDTKLTDGRLLIMEDIITFLTAKGNLTCFMTGIPVLSLRIVDTKDTRFKDPSNFLLFENDDRRSPDQTVNWEIRCTSPEKSAKIQNSIAKAKRLQHRYTPEERAMKEEKYRQNSQRAANIMSKIIHNDDLLRDKVLARQSLQRELCEIESPADAHVFDNFDPYKELDVGELLNLQQELLNELCKNSISKDEALQQYKASFQSNYNKLLVAHHQNENKLINQEAEILKFKHLASFRRSDGVIESEDKKSMAQKAQALKELELEKKRYEELQSKLEKEKLDLSRQDARIREERQKVDQERRELNEDRQAYQRQLEVLRHAQKSSQPSVSSVDAPRIKSRISSEGFSDKRRSTNERTQSRERRSMDPVPKRQLKSETIPIHLAHSAVNESANPRNSMRQSSPLFALAESSGKSSSSLSKLASSNSKSRLKSK